MHRGTLMVLKRILTTALGALGLGAFVGGPASAQQIPAPDLFDGQVNCSMHIMPQDAMDNMDLGMTLMMRVMAGMAIIDTDDDGVPDGTDETAFEGLNAIIEPGNSNCSSDDFVMNATGDFLDAMGDVTTTEANYVPISLAGDAAAVGEGYTAALDAYLATRDADAAVKTAQDALDVLLEDEIEDDIQAVSITTAREAVTTAQTAKTAADTKLYEVGHGPINMAGIAEWRAKFAVEDAVKAYNTAVRGVTTASDALNANAVEIDSYVALRETDLIDGLVDNDVVNLANLRNYANATGNNAAVQDAMTGGITNAPDTNVTGNFDAAGNLLIPKTDTDETDAVKLEPTEGTSTYMSLNARLTMVNDTVEALETLQSENQNALLQATIDEGVRRAKLEQAHYQGQFDALVANTTVDVNATMDGVQTIASLYGAYTAATTTRDNAGVDLETKFADRVAKTSSVVAAFTSPQDFYQQLVDRRNFEKAAADAVVTRLAGLTGDDAATEAMTTAATEAATAAQKALDEATATQASFQGLLAEDSPVKGLVEELLKSDATGDDGGALVDAIVGAYDAASDAVADATAAAEAAVAGLTGEDGAVAQNTGRIEANETNIAQNTSDIAELDGRVTVNEGDIETNTTMIGENRDLIVENAGNIATNSTNIASNEGRITVNEGAIAQNVSDILANAGNIAMNNTYIMENRGMIGQNATDIMAVRGMATANAADIASNRGMIGDNFESIQTLKAGVAASMALAGMPEIGDRGVAVGAGSYDGETAIAVGVHFSGENSRFKIGITSADGETGASVGAGWSF